MPSKKALLFALLVVIPLPAKAQSLSSRGKVGLGLAVTPMYSDPLSYYKISPAPGHNILLSVTIDHLKLEPTFFYRSLRSGYYDGPTTNWGSGGVLSYRFPVRKHSEVYLGPKFIYQENRRTSERDEIFSYIAIERYVGLALGTEYLFDDDFSFGAEISALAYNATNIDPDRGVIFSGQVILRWFPYVW